MATSHKHVSHASRMVLAVVGETLTKRLSMFSEGVPLYVIRDYSLVTVTILEPPQHIRGRHSLTGVNTQPAHEVPSVFPMRLGGSGILPDGNPQANPLMG